MTTESFISVLGKKFKMFYKTCSKTLRACSHHVLNMVIFLFVEIQFVLIVCLFLKTCNLWLSINSLGSVTVLCKISIIQRLELKTYHNKNKKCKDLGYVFAPFDRQEGQHGTNSRLENRRCAFWYWVCHLLLPVTWNKSQPLRSCFSVCKRGQNTSVHLSQGNGSHCYQMS